MKKDLEKKQLEKILKLLRDGEISERAAASKILSLLKSNVGEDEDEDEKADSGCFKDSGGCGSSTKMPKPRSANIIKSRIKDEIMNNYSGCHRSRSC